MVQLRIPRKYKVYFIIGITILVFQLYLAVQFFSLNIDSSTSAHAPHKQFDGIDVENSVSSDRRIKDGLIDDEDLGSEVRSRKRTSADSKNLTRLRLEELDFVPPCEIVTKDAISAIHRAKTQKCKQHISNVTCLIQNGLLYPKSLRSSCPSEGFVAGRSLGCFKDEKNYRLLSGYFGNYKSSNSPDFCMKLCLQSGFQYAGVQYS